MNSNLSNVTISHVVNPKHRVREVIEMYMAPVTDQLTGVVGYTEARAALEKAILKNGILHDDHNGHEKLMTEYFLVVKYGIMYLTTAGYSTGFCLNPVKLSRNGEELHLSRWSIGGFVERIAEGQSRVDQAQAYNAGSSEAGGYIVAVVTLY